MIGFTILGAGGALGQALVARLRSAAVPVLPVTRNMLPALLGSDRNIGNVINCVGLTGDFRSRALDTANAHVAITVECLKRLRFESFLFLSSTRVYAHAASTHEQAALPCRPDDPSDLYNITKLAGEALCLSDPRPTVRVVRLSNVYGVDMPETFLSQVIREGRATGAVQFRQGSDSEKDYVSADAVVTILPEISRRGSRRLYNLASGRNTRHATIARILREEAGWNVSFLEGALVIRFPTIDTTRLESEFGPILSTLSEDLPRLIRPGQEVQCSPSTRPADG
jgi:nucleoside-diphosphate-sugar epimerase